MLLGWPLGGSSAEHVEGTEHVLVEGGHITDDAGSWNRGEVHEPVERRLRSLLRPRRGIVLTEERIDRLTVVREVDPHQARTTLPGRVQGDNLMSSLTEHSNHTAPELARPTSYGDPHRCLLSRHPGTLCHPWPPYGQGTAKRLQHENFSGRISIPAQRPPEGEAR